MPVLTVVVPAFNESEGLREFHRRLTSVLDGMTDLDCAVLYVDDGSRDDTWAIMCALREGDPRVATLRLARNFGKELALTAGLDHVTEGGAVVIDADLQDPPELIPDFVAHWRDGFDVIYGTRATRAGESGLKKLTASGFYRIMERLSTTPIPRDTGDFRLLSRRVLDALGQVRERQRFMKGLFTWVGFRQLSVVYHRDPRHAGQTKWNYWKLWNFAVEGITSFSTVPLRLATYCGIGIAVIAFAYAGWIFYKTLAYGDPVKGYPSLMVVVLFLGGGQLIGIGVLGEYLGRMFNETKNRPLYFLNEHSPSALGRAARDPEVGHD